MGQTRPAKVTRDYESYNVALVLPTALEGQWPMWRRLACSKKSCPSTV